MLVTGTVWTMTETLIQVSLMWDLSCAKQSEGGDNKHGHQNNSVKMFRTTRDVTAIFYFPAIYV